MKSLSPHYSVELVVEKRAHFYEVYNLNTKDKLHRFPGVTGFLSVINKPALIPWAKKEALFLVREELLRRSRTSPVVTLEKLWIEDLLVAAMRRPDDIKEEAATIGTQAHAFIDLIVHGQEPKDIPEVIRTPVEAFKKWWAGSGIELVKGDTKVASLIHKFGGSLDALGRREGKFVILDWKTSNGIYLEYALQVAAYAQAFFETYGIYAQEGIIVRFGKKLPIDFETKEICDLENSFQAFLSAKRLKELLGERHFKEEIWT